MSDTSERCLIHGNVFRFDRRSGFEICTSCEQERENPIRWNPYNKVVQDHRDGTILHILTNEERAKRGMAVPWTPEISEREVREPACP